MPSAHPSASVYTHMPSLLQHKMQMSCPWLPHRPSAHPSALMCILSWSSTHNDLSSCLQPSLASSQHSLCSQQHTCQLHIAAPHMCSHVSHTHHSSGNLTSSLRSTQQMLGVLQLGTSLQLPCMMHSSCPSSPYMPSAHPSASVYTHMPSLQQHKMQMSCPWLPHRPSAHPSALMCI